MKLNIAIVMGGYSSEHDISIKSAKVVFKYLDKSKYNPYLIHITPQAWYYECPNGNKHPINKANFTLTYNQQNITFDCIFNAIHGSPGEDGLLQAYFALQKLPQTSCDFYQAALTFNKRDLLRTLAPYEIPCAKAFYFDKGDVLNAKAVVKKVGLPCFVKANRSGSSYGITKVYKAQDMQAAIQTALKEDQQVLIEESLEGTEVSVGVITYQGKTTVLPITEIVSHNDFFDYQAKYEGKSEEITPARITLKQEQNVQAMAQKIYTVLGLKGFTRSEFIFKDNTPYLLEVNTTPGLTEESILPQQALAAGISLPALFDSAITAALP